MFNIEGSELIFLLLIALIVLGPEKLPDAIRKAGRAYAEFKKMANGFQGELKQALDEPMRELRDTADAMRAAANFDLSSEDSPPAAPTTPTSPVEPIQREPGLNFGSANPRRTQPAASDQPSSSATEPERPAGLNFGSANPRRRDVTPEVTTELVVDPPQSVDPEVAAAPPAPAAPPVKKERPPGGTPVPRHRPAAAEPEPAAAQPPPVASTAEDIAE